MTIALKTYSNASNARRAAKAAGLSEFDIYKGADGWYKIRVAVAKAVKPAKATKEPKKKIGATAPKESKEPKEPQATKAAKLIDLITEGATITELTEALGWQRHTVRAALCRLSKLGYAVKRTKVGTNDGFESHYKIAA
jgi:hypothetical protein